MANPDYMNHEDFEPYWCPVQTLVLQDNTLSDAAFRLYALYQIKITNGGWIGIQETKAANWLGWSLQKYRKTRNELIKKRWVFEIPIFRAKVGGSPVVDGMRMYTQPKVGQAVQDIQDWMESEDYIDHAERMEKMWEDHYLPLLKLSM